MANSTQPIPNEVLISSVIFKFIAMVFGVLGNTTVIIYTIFTQKEKTPTSYLVGNLALADLFVCLTFYPIWITEFIQTMFYIESDQDIFCKLSRSTIGSFTFASVIFVLAITVDRFLYIIKPLKYVTIITKRRVLTAIVGIWVTACSLLIVLFLSFRTFDGTTRYLCDLEPPKRNRYVFIFYIYAPLTSILILNTWILIIARKQRKKILAEAMSPQLASLNKMSAVRRFFHAYKSVKTFSVVIGMLSFCIIAPSLIGFLMHICRNKKSLQMWFSIFHFELYGINSVVNAYIYGKRHVKQRKAYTIIIWNLLHCKKATNV